MTMKSIFSLARMLGALALAGVAGQSIAAPGVTITPASTTYTAAGGDMTFNVSLSYTEAISSLGFEIVQPTGWKLVSSSGSVGVAPDPNQTGLLPFVWFSIPASPVNFSFTVNYPAGLSGNQVFTGIVGRFSDASAVETPVASPNITLVLAAAPTFTSANNATFIVGQSNSFTVTAAGGPAPTLSLTGSLPTGVSFDAATGVLSGMPSSFAGSPFNVTFTATNASGSVQQSFALNVQAAPTIASHPANATVVLGNTATFTVGTAGNPAPSIQWQKQDAGGGGFSNITNDSVYSGATTATLSVNATNKNLNGTQYRAVATNGVTPPATSNAATLTVHFAPEFSQQPQSQTVGLGTDVTFTAQVTGNPTPSLQWRFNNSPIEAATGSSLAINSAGPANAGTYVLVATNSIGNPVNSNPAVLAFNPTIANFTPASGPQNTVVTLNGAGFTGAKAVTFNGLAAASFTVVSDFVITATVPTFATTGPIVVTRANDATLTATPVFSVIPGRRLVNTSVLTATLGGESAVAANFTVEGTAPKPILVRAVGPGLSAFNVQGTLADPFVSIYDSAGVQIASNNNWDSSLASTFDTVGAFALTAGSADAALAQAFPPGTYTARVTGVGGTTGQVLLEVYELTADSRVSHLSTRSSVAAGGASSTGIALGGAGTSGSTTLLIRAVGSGLGVPGAMANPVVTVFTGTTQIATNDNFGTSTNLSDINAATAAVGAMPLAANDAAVLVTLPGGAHSIRVAGAGGSAGIVMTEVFVVDSFLPATIPPALLAPFHRQEVNLGGTATFAAPFIGKPNPVFQWQKAPLATVTPPTPGTFADIAGATGQTHTVTVAGESDLAFYRVALTASGNTLHTAPGQVDVIKVAQSINFAQLDPRAFELDATFNLTATATSNLPVTFTSSAPAVASVTPTGTVTIHDVGSATITASQPGNSVYSPAPNIERTLVINKATAQVVISDLAATFDNTPKPVAVTTTPASLPVTVTYAPVAGGSAVTTPPTNAGSYTVVATVDHPHYQGSATQTLVIAKANQEITFAAIPPKTFGDAPFELSASASSGLPVSITAAHATVATLSGTTVTIVASGPVTFTATQAGDNNYNPAPSVDQILTVAKAAASVVLTNLSHVYNGSLKGAGAETTPPGLQVAFTYTGTAAATTAPTDAGSYGVTATIDDTRYQGSISGTITIAKAPQTIAFTSFPANGAAALDDTPFSITASATSTLPVTYASSNSAVATINATTGAVTLVGTGTTTITASLGESANYLAAPDATQTLTISNASQTIDFAALASRVFAANETFTITATAKGKTGTATNLPVAFVSSNPAVATVGTPSLNVTTGATTATVSVLAAGTTNIVASQGGSPNFAAAADVSRALVITPAPAAVVFTSGVLAQTYSGSPRVVTATTEPSGLNVVITYGTGAAASSDAPVNAGTYPVTATIQENNYTGSVSGDLVVAKATQTIEFAAVGAKLRSDAPFALSATASSGLTEITFSSSNSAVASISGSTATLRGTGTTTLTASQAGNGNYEPGTATQQLVVKPDAPVISSIPSATVRGVKGSPMLYGPIGINPGAAPYTFSVTGALPAGLAINPANGNISGTPTATGSFPVTIVVNNDTHPSSVAANANNSRAIAFTIDPAVPAFTTPPTASNATVGTAYTGFAAPTLADGTTGVTFSATNLPAGLTLNTSTGAITGTPTEAGSFVVQLTATNSTGSATVPVSITVVMPANAPVYSGPANPSGKVGVAFSFTPNFGAAGGSPTTFAAITTGLPPGVTFNASTGVFTGTPTQAGSFPITISATRVGITASAEVTITINPPDIAPVVGFPVGSNPLSLRAGTAIATGIQLTVTPAAPAATFAATGLPTGLSLSASGVLTGTATQIGTFDVQVTATTTGTSPVAGPAATWRISVQPAQTAPVISSAAVVTGQVGVAINPLTLTALPATPAPVFALVTTGLDASISPTLPAGLSLVGNTISGTPTAAGSTTVMFVATAEGLTGPGQELTFNIAPAANVPVVESNGSAAGTVGQTFTYQIAASNGPITGYSLAPRSALPAGLAFTASTGTIFGVPSAPTATPIVVDLVATNASGNSNPKPLSITIVAPPATPVIANSGATVSGRVGVALTAYQITASESPSAFAASGLPPGVVLAGGTGQITGTPTTSGAFTAQVSAGNAAGFGASAPLHFSIAAAAQAPVIGGSAPAAGRVGTAFSYQIVASGSPTSFALTGNLPSGLALNSSRGLIFGTPTEAGLFAISVTATNDGGTSLPQSFAINILSATDAPVILSAVTANATVGQPFSYEILATNISTTRPLVPPESLDAVNLPAGLVANPAMGRIEGVPTTVGTVRASLVGTNAAGSGPVRDLLIEVQPALTAPMVTSPGAASGQVGVAFAFQITASGTVTSYEVRNGPAWLTVNTANGALSGVPSEPGLVQVWLVAANGAFASAPSPLTINVAAASGAPIVSAGSATTGNVGVAYLYQIPASGTGTLSYSAQGLPAGLSVNASSGVISGTPTASGTFAVRVSARNASGVSYPAVIALTIKPSFNIN